MAKKRRDKKRDPSTLQKLSKVGTTALAAGAGAVFLGRRPGINKFLTETASPLIRNTRGFKKDLIGKNKLGDIVDCYVAIIDTDQVNEYIDPMNKLLGILQIVNKDNNYE